MSPPVALSIAGSDSGGGAGIQGDLRTFAALGVFAATAITAITAQSTTEIRLVEVLPVDVVRAQITTVLGDLPVAAVKTGMLGDGDIVELVAELAGRGSLPNLVVDPVLVASSGARLLTAGAETRYRERLLPLARVFTPNLAEAGALLDATLETGSDQRDAAVELARRMSGVVVVTGGDTDGDAIDVVCRDGDVEELRAPRVPTVNTHGTGCAFASAIAAGLARGLDDLIAIKQAKQFVHDAIQGATRWHLGSGPGPLDHFHREVLK
jgi:hydroxymethylpyrimidine/phosphomethylpyrimidine kinase